MGKKIAETARKSTSVRTIFPLKAEIMADGWLSPDTYCSSYSPLIDGPAVYLFARYDRDVDWREFIVAYVGMSTRLEQRILGHNIRPMLNDEKFWTQCWFKPTPAANLRDEERRYIDKYNPPWNIIGRRRGLIAA